MNVCMLVWSYWPVPTGGAEGQCRKLSRSLATQNVHCTVLTARLRLDTPSREKDGNIDIVRIPTLQMWIAPIIEWRKKQKRKNDVGEIKSPISRNNKSSADRTLLIDRIVRWLNSLMFIVGATIWLFMHKRKIDILHVHYTDWIAGYGGWMGAMFDIPVVCKVANMPVFSKKDLAIPFGRIWDVWRTRTHYIAMHDAIEKGLMEEKVPGEMIYRVPNGIEVPLDKAEPGSGEYVLFVGNFTQGVAHKGFDILFQAWKEVCSCQPDVKLVLAGQGDVSIWKNMTEELRCSSNVHFAGYVDCTADLYRRAALLVLPSRHEGMSNALLEAQAWGLPAVVSDIPGNRAVLIDGINGIVVPVGNHLLLASAICHLLDNPKARVKMGKSARSHIKKHFNMASVADKYKLVYIDLIERKQRTNLKMH